MRTWILFLFCLAVLVALANAERGSRRKEQEVEDSNPKKQKNNNRENDIVKKRGKKKEDSNPKKQRNDNRENDIVKKRRKKKEDSKRDGNKKKVNKESVPKGRKVIRKKKPKGSGPIRGKSIRPRTRTKTVKPMKCRGTCIEKTEKCNGQTQGKRGCKGGAICCMKLKLRNQVKGKTVKRFCKPTYICKGECRKKKTGCKLDEKRFKNKKNKKYCDKNSCYCCVKQCNTKRKCKNAGGMCTLKKACKEDTFIKSSKHCDGKKCGCCISGPPKPCKSKKTCTKAGGTCMFLTSGDCDGDILVTNDAGKKYCKGDTCGCCLPEDPEGPLFGYKENNGPPLWPSWFPLCGGKAQSPINIVTEDAVGPFPWSHFVFENYDATPTSMLLFNNGQTAEVDIELPSPPTIRGGGLEDTFAFQQFHFHWGSDDTKGSEHNVDGKRYAAELHIVHFNTKYETIEKAIQFADGLAVLGIFLEIDSKDNPNLESVINGLGDIKKADTETEIEHFPLEDLLPEDVDHFYRYQGSLTTPTCNEIVTWTVFKDTTKISSSQVAKFRLLLTAEGHALIDNFRPVQALNGREVFKGSEELHWTYTGSVGPAKWPTYFPLCGGKSQSPIDIVTSDAVGDYDWIHFHFKNYDVAPKEMTILNNGHTAQLTVTTDNVASIVGGSLEGEYTFLQLHFHWGSDNTKGSEHTVDGKRYPAEVHLVHFKTEYGNAAEAIKHEDGLAVLGIFLKIDGSDNNKLTSLIHGIKEIHEADASASITPFALADLLPSDTDNFYRYHGSLTTPTCNEIVTWTVFKEHITISASQIEEFRKLVDEEEHSLSDNFRPVQDLNGRTVYKGLAAPHWSYEGKSGPEFWSTFFPLCGLESQSPIDIVVADTKGNYHWTPFNFEHYDAVPTSMTLKNNGHSATVSIDLSPEATIQGGDLDGEYTFAQFHLHWGRDDSVGSEHTINGQSYPSELHLVHYKSSYGNIGEAIKHADGLAVLGVFLEISDADNAKLNSIINGLGDVHEPDTETSITPFALEDLLPAHPDEFYRYQGSLTTPTCNEIVTWTVFNKTLKISSAQMDKFRELKDEEGKHLVDNFRPVQKLNGRTVYKGDTTPHWSYMGSSGPSFWSKYFPICADNSQSPINIITAAATGSFPWVHFNLQNYDTVPTSMTISNNGHAAQVSAVLDSAATVQGGGLEGEYTFLQFHFHWGSTDAVGSEHQVDGKTYPNEIHLVHYKTSYGSVGEAIKHEDGLAVLGAFLEIDANDNMKLDSIIKGLANIHEAGTEASITPFALKDVLPANVDEFYRYSGSLTTPTCNEVVTWTVFKDTIKISSTQMVEFRKLEDDAGHKIVDNFRPVQPLNGRPVKKGRSSPHWSYEGESGPSHWKDDFALCAGTSQSPINIVTSSTVSETSWAKFTFTNYNSAPTKMELLNNGHTAQVVIEATSVPKFQGGNLPEYTFAQFHFHWGANDSVGSEHTVDGNRFPSELHLVHFKSSYGTIGEAIKNADGLAVLGIMLQIAGSDNAKLNNIISVLDKIVDADTTAAVTPFKMEDLLPSNTDDFYRYLGSLTTPTCNEVVIWTVFKNPITISATQMAKFRLLEDEAGHKIVDNFRPVQPLNGRQVSHAVLP